MRRKFKVGDKVRRKPRYCRNTFEGHEETVFTVEEVFLDINAIVLRDFALYKQRWDMDYFDLVRNYIPSFPVKMSELPTEGLSLEEVLERWEKLDAAGLIIKED